MKSHKEDSSAMVKRFLRPVIIGAVVGALCCTLLLAVMAAIVASQDIPKAAITPMAIVAAAAGAFFGGFAAARIACLLYTSSAPGRIWAGPRRRRGKTRKALWTICAGWNEDELKRNSC